MPLQTKRIRPFFISCKRSAFKQRVASLQDAHGTLKCSIRRWLRKARLKEGLLTLKRLNFKVSSFFSSFHLIIRENKWSELSIMRKRQRLPDLWTNETKIQSARGATLQKWRKLLNFEDFTDLLVKCDKMSDFNRFVRVPPCRMDFWWFWYKKNGEIRWLFL